jgi:lipopolysaccharide transport system ATP-binding protein
MTRAIISVENLGKHYNLGLRPEGSKMFSHWNRSLREAVEQAVRSGLKSMWKKNDESADSSSFWALRNVSFEVNRGEVIGLIGRNGAGKSTLLKIFSRITDPTEGLVRMRGRAATLLEVGTGFHPELSGRENIYLNGAILGMKRSEITRKFDEIIAFSEIEQFLDTPVKRYSSGMYVRLAFAVAAHLEPDILIIDEVLAVGDQAFQKKCLGKMQEVASTGGRTVLFVSHNLGALAQLCDRGVYLEEGTVRTIGPVKDVIQTYLKSSREHNAERAVFANDPAKAAQFLSAEIIHSDGSPGSEFTTEEPVIIRMTYDVRKALAEHYLTFYLQNMEGTRVLFSDVRDADPEIANRITVGTHTFDVLIPPGLLAPTTYLLTVGSIARYVGTVDHHHSCCEFTLRDLSSQEQAPMGVIGVKLPWDYRSNGTAPAAARV